MKRLIQIILILLSTSNSIDASERTQSNEEETQKELDNRLCDSVKSNSYWRTLALLNKGANPNVFCKCYLNFFYKPLVLCTNKTALLTLLIKKGAKLSDEYNNPENDDEDENYDEVIAGR